MLIRVSSYIIFTKLLTITQCAPKLGPLSFDPLISEIGSPVNELPPPEPFIGGILREKEDEKKAPDAQEEIRRPCNGYDFDEQNCKLVNNRILCGYNKNVGGNNDKELVDMGNGCHMKGDRIECGYITGPFEGIRRPDLQADAKAALRYLSIRKGKVDSPIIKKLKAVLLSRSNETDVSNKNKNSEGTNNTTTKLTETEHQENSSNITSNPIPRNSSSTNFVTLAVTAVNNTTIKTGISDLSDSSPEFLEEMTNVESEDEPKPTTDKEGTANVTSKTEISSVKETTVSASQDSVTESTIKTSKSFSRIKIKRRSTSQNKTQSLNLTFCVEKQDRIVCYDEQFLPKNRTIQIQIK